MKRFDCSPGNLRCSAENRQRGHPGRGEETSLSQTLGTRNPCGQGGQLCAHWPGPTSSRDAGVSPLLCLRAPEAETDPSAPSLCPFGVGLLAFLLLTLQSSLCIQNTRPNQICDLQVFFPGFGLSLCSLLCREATDFDELNFDGPFLDHGLDVTSEKYLPKPKSQRFHLVFFSRSLIVFTLFMSMIRFKSRTRLSD